MNTLYIVIPCYNEEAVLQSTTAQLNTIIGRLEASGKVTAVKVLYVDDGSRDKTWHIITEQVKQDCHYAGLKLAHNVGHQSALWAGMENVADVASAVITIDADLQDDIEVIERMVDDFDEGYDIVYGVRDDRTSDSAFKRRTAVGFYWTMRRMGCDIVHNHADFRLLSKRALLSLLTYTERNLFLRGIIPQLGYRHKCEYYSRKERQEGETKYPLIKMLNFAVDGITSFSVVPLRWILGFGLVCILASMGVIVYAVVAYCVGNVVPGWTSLLVSLWFIGGTLLIAIGIVGEYVGKIYTEVKRRPRYFVEEKLNV